jgi:mRNA interferase MazF
MVRRGWVPDAGEVIWLELSPTTGREQAGHRPALVMSPASYNGRAGLLLACAITRQEKGYPFEVLLPDGSVVLADQIKCLDWRSRSARFKERAPKKAVERVRELLAVLLQIDTD